MRTLYRSNMDSVNLLRNMLVNSDMSIEKSEHTSLSGKIFFHLIIEVLEETEGVLSTTIDPYHRGRTSES